MTVEEILRDRNITEFLHFTTNRGVVGTLATRTLLSREQLPKESFLEHVLHLNANFRAEAQPYFDKSERWLDFVNLSVSAVNSRFFATSRGWHHRKEVWWAILSFDPIIATHPGVRFATTNNAYEHCERGVGSEGFNELFKPTVRCKGTWSIQRGNRPKYLPTCEQAELLYPKSLSTDFLRKIYVESENHQDIVVAWLDEFNTPNVPVFVEPEKFNGVPN